MNATIVEKKKCHMISNSLCNLPAFLKYHERAQCLKSYFFFPLVSLPLFSHIMLPLGSFSPFPLHLFAYCVSQILANVPGFLLPLLPPYPTNPMSRAQRDSQERQNPLHIIYSFLKKVLFN